MPGRSHYYVAANVIGVHYSCPDTCPHRVSPARVVLRRPQLNTVLCMCSKSILVATGAMLPFKDQYHCGNIDTQVHDNVVRRLKESTEQWSGVECKLSFGDEECTASVYLRTLLFPWHHNGEKEEEGRKRKRKSRSVRIEQVCTNRAQSVERVPRPFPGTPGVASQ